MDRLQEILSTMDVPLIRMTDIGWLSRNLGIRNARHPEFKEAEQIIKKLMREG